MSATDYIIDILLIGIVLRQIRPRPLTERSVLLPAALLAFAGAEYLKGFPTGGNDVVLDGVLILAGAALGSVSGMATEVWSQPETGVMCRAGIVAASVWVLGMGLRFGFDIWANTASGQTSLLHFSEHHAITSAQAFVTAFVLMAFAQVIFRVSILQFRRIRSPRNSPATSEAVR